MLPKIARRCKCNAEQPNAIYGEQGTGADVAKVANEAIQNNILHVNTDTTIFDAFRIAERYGFSFYDTLSSPQPSNVIAISFTPKTCTPARLLKTV
jgi:hypothetical protein